MARPPSSCARGWLNRPTTGRPGAVAHDEGASRGSTTHRPHRHRRHRGLGPRPEPWHQGRQSGPAAPRARRGRGAHTGRAAGFPGRAGRAGPSRVDGSPRGSPGDGSGLRSDAPDGRQEHRTAPARTAERRLQEEAHPRRQAARPQTTPRLEAWGLTRPGCRIPRSSCSWGRLVPESPPGTVALPGRRGRLFRRPARCGRRWTARPRGQSAGAACAPDRRAGTGAEQRDRYVALADLGVDTVFVGVVDLEGPGDVSRLAPMTA
ncbi:hypothetical protein SAMN05216561_11160 [Nocardioides psychrotolerans]|uniref:Luciferase-like monooxygenase n=1 Tax=Nocardioides psychrotolerans TaxID=1005945 RepID=A0A1I3JXX2_9ACTN|nr:hypothetical protein SAMN05216561_11160 [Nocardioides psychrotolerans]